MEALDGDSMKSFFKEMQQQFMAELDFRKEVANLNEIRGSTGPAYEGCVECGSIDRLIPDPPVHSGCNPRDDRFHRFKKKPPARLLRGPRLVCDYHCLCDLHAERRVLTVQTNLLSDPVILRRSPRFSVYPFPHLSSGGWCCRSP